MRTEQILTMFDYHYGMFEQVWQCVLDLTSAQFVAETDYSLGSVRNQLVHCLSVDNRWLARIQGQAPPPGLQESDYPDAQSLRGDWETISERVLRYVRGLTPADLDESVALHFPDRGGARHNTRWQILLHVVNHGTDHRAQILARLHELGAPTLEQDLILHLWATED